MCKYHNDAPFVSLVYGSQYQKSSGNQNKRQLRTP